MPLHSTRTLILGPTFSLRLNTPPHRVAKELGSVADPDFPYVITDAGSFFQIAVLPAQRSFWSPWLTLDVRGMERESTSTVDAASLDGSDQSCEVFGRFNPCPSIWTAYMLASLALLTLAAGAGMWGLAELTLGRPPRAFWAIPTCLVVLAAMWAISAAGQGLARDQMTAMREAVEGVLRGVAPST